jgi:4-aminobutyrate aminotransferase/(S)-3-amino-2-methylpropionate transaminase
MGYCSKHCYEDAFHGRSLLALGLTSKTSPYKIGFAPYPSDIYRIPYAYCYRCAFGKKYPSCELACAEHLQEVFKRVVSPESVAAVIAEPLLGEGGFITPPKEFFRTVAEICKRHGILFIADEVQTGIARTGTLFASEQFGVEPDMLIAAKSLGGGLPIASVTGRAEIMDAPGVGGLGGTFIGNPVSCAAALAVLDMVESGNLCGRAQALGDRFVERAKQWQRRWPIIGAIHGAGAMRAIELVRDPETREPADAETKQVVRYCYEHGLLTISAGTFGNIIRLLMPLVITDQQFDEALRVMEEALAQAAESVTVSAKGTAHA